MAAKIKHSGLSNEFLLEQTFKILHAPLLFYAAKFVKDTDIAKDLVQDAFLNLLSNTNSEKEIVNLKSYLYKCVRNNCLNYLNHLIIKQEFHEYEINDSKREISFYDSHQTLVEKELYESLITAIDELPEHYRTPFRMSRFDNLRNKEIAEQLNLPLRTIETQIYRALTILKKKFEKHFITLYSLLIKSSR